MKYNVKDFTLEEKLKLLNGKSPWMAEDLNGKLSPTFMCDGPNGLRKIEVREVETQDQGVYVSKETLPATVMPALSVVANSWNTETAYLDGQTIADECIEYNVDLLLAPGINVKRNVLNGRNFEYLAEDPYLIGKMARAFVEGVQDKGVGTSVKHYLANSMEYDRTKTSSEIDERTLREIYLPAFEECVKAKPWTVMTGYNCINGVHADEHVKLVKGVLRGEFGFDGVVVSDWNAITYHPNSIKATVDLRMPYNRLSYVQLVEGLEKGEITEQDIDERAQKVLDLIEKKENAVKNPPEFTKEKRHQNAVDIAKDGIVLLKNEDSALPLKNNEKICVLGVFDEKPVYCGGGSASVKTLFETKSLSALLKESQKEVKSLAVTKENGANGVLNLQQGCEYAYCADKVILCVGETANQVKEACDRESLKLTPAQEDLIIQTAKYNENVIVLIYAGGVIDMSAWIDKVKAVVFVGFAGEGVQEAVASIVTGQTVPSGKITETFPLKIEDTVTQGKNDNGQAEWYKEGIFVGYRHYDRENLEVLYPFGHGLSYAKFEYSNLTVEKKGETDYTVSYDIKNLSNIDAKEVSQVYIKDVFASVVRPEKELKGFSKDMIKAGETKRVSVELDFRSFAYYSTALDKWTVESGAFEIMVGASSRDIRLTAKINVENNNVK